MRRYQDNSNSKEKEFALAHAVHHGRQQEDEASLSSCISSQKAQSEKEVMPGYKASVLACLPFINLTQV